MKKFSLFISFIIFSLFVSAQNLTLEPFGPTFLKPINVKNAGDNRLFIVEQKGYVKILNADGTSPSTPFLDIESLVFDDIVNFWERGFLGLVFHPNYATNGYFYVYYTDQNGDSIIARYTVSNSDPNVADPNSAFVILKVIQPYDAHLGGEMVFDSNGYLYIGFGDGGTTTGDPENRAQNLSEFIGKIIRIDVDNPANGKNYSIPASNPYANDGDPNTLGEVWSLGLRNPARFSIDDVTGDMWIADTGHNSFEEIDLNVGNASGLNYGWKCYEGNAVFDASAGCDVNTLTFPINEYYHFEPDGIFRCAVIGGLRYRGSSLSGLYGTYFFADWCSYEIFMLNWDGSNWIRTSYIPSITSQRWTGFAEDINNEIYITGYDFADNVNGGAGQIYKIKINTLSNNAIDSKLEFNLIPNPTSNGKISLNFSNTISLKEINAYNLHGQRIKVSLSNLNSRTINLEFKELSAGIYIIEAISTSGERSVNKLIIK
jgi:glucose/arabinose dehydrogenase